MRTSTHTCARTRWLKDVARSDVGRWQNDRRITISSCAMKPFGLWNPTKPFSLGNAARQCNGADFVEKRRSHLSGCHFSHLYSHRNRLWMWDFNLRHSPLRPRRGLCDRCPRWFLISFALERNVIVSSPALLVLRWDWKRKECSGRKWNVSGNTTHVVYDSVMLFYYSLLLPSFLISLSFLLFFFLSCRWFPFLNCLSFFLRSSLYSLIFIFIFLFHSFFVFVIISLSYFLYSSLFYFSLLQLFFSFFLFLCFRILFLIFFLSHFRFSFLL